MYDAVVAIGIFTVKADDSEEYFRKTVAELWNMSRNALVFTVLTKKHTKPHEKAYSLPKILEVAEKHTERVAVDRATLPYVATVGMYR